MALNLRHPGRVLAAGVVALIILSQLPARWLDAIGGPPSHVVSAVVGMAGDPLLRLARFVRPPAELQTELTRNEELKANLEAQTQYALNLEARLNYAIAEIRRLLGVREQLNREGFGESVRLLPARVIAIPPDLHAGTVLINRGTTHGVGPGMIVASGFSLIGRVTDVGPRNATVRLVTAPDAFLQVRIIPPMAGEAERELIAQVTINDDRDRFVAEVPQNAPIQPEDLVTLYDPDWPVEAQGFVVGVVERIDPNPDDPEIRSVATIQPVREPGRVMRVTVVVPRESSADGEGP